MTSTGTMRLGLFINPTGHHQASWRHSDADADAGVSFDHYRRVALAAEWQCFDMIFLADNQAVRDTDPETGRRVAQYIANFEPFTLLSALAAVTDRIGLTCTASMSYNFPFQIARKFASLDFISGGRSGWNMVTSERVEAPNFGIDDQVMHDDRYRRGDEVVRVCLGLWDSWEDDAFLRGSRAGMQVIGSYMEVADLMEDWFTTGAADGFNIQPAYFPGMFNEFVSGVMPELRRRGLVREGYQGRTLREHFGLPRPAWGSRSHHRAGQ